MNPEIRIAAAMVTANSLSNRPKSRPQQDGNEHRRQRQSHREDGNPIASTFEAASEVIRPSQCDLRFQTTMVIDHKADARMSAMSEIVCAKAKQIHHANVPIMERGWQR
jgi:hypothetical protein